MKSKRVIIIALIITIMLLSLGCKKDVSEDKELIIAEQFGLAYAPIQIMKDKNFLSDRLKGYDITWVKLGNTAAIREAMVSDSLDVGFLGIPPFLIGYENGMDWGIFSGISSSPLGLVSNDENIKTLKDIKNTDRIALPQPGSIQHILLSMAAKKEFGDAKYFDNQLVTLNHPDAMSALLSGSEVKLHFTSPPYLFEELNQSTTSLVISGDECFGSEFTFIVGITTEKLKNNEKVFKSLNLAVQDSIDFMNENKEETIEILSNYYDYDKDTLTDYIYNSNMKYDSKVNGIDRFVEFMHNNGYLEKTYEEDDLIW